MGKMKIKFKDGTEKDFANLRNADLSNACMGNADLSNADLSNADLSNADLSYANLRNADLRGASLSNANLSKAYLDFSCWPLWCGSMSPKIDKRLACQLLYHALRAMQSCDDPEVQEFLRCSTAITLANQFHRTYECGRIQAKERTTK
jgi:uncharacterized protein YjbI with pentapeptide repeats